MKCKICGYEIEKPNQRKCPCCGQILELEETVQQPEKITPDMEEQQEKESNDANVNQSEPQVSGTCPMCNTLIHGGNFCPNCGYDMRKKDESFHEELFESVPETVQYRQITPEVINSHIEEREQEKYQEIREEKQIQDQPNTNSEILDNEKHKVKFPSDNIQSYEYPDDPNHGYYTAEIEDDGKYDTTISSSDNSWIYIMLAGIGSILIGALLYLFI